MFTVTTKKLLTMGRKETHLKIKKKNWNGQTGKQKNVVLTLIR